MKPPLFVRPLSPEESRDLRAGLRSPSAFTLRRSQILLASAEGLKPSEIRARLGCATQTVRDALRAFAAEGTACLHEKSHPPTSAPPPPAAPPPPRRPPPRAAPRPAAPQSPRLRQADGRLDPGHRRRGLPRA